MRVILLEGTDLDCGSEVTFPGPLWEKTPAHKIVQALVYSLASVPSPLSRLSEQDCPGNSLLAAIQ
ncbi:hypothetical protein STEG23_021038, partial [Scotinomys teguina]